MGRLLPSALVAPLLFSPVACATGSAKPAVPQTIAVPAGHELLFKIEARGVQIYAAAAKSGELQWTHEAPLADLLDGAGDRAGFHYDGPSWEAMDGSKVVRDGAPMSVDAPSPKDIPWLLVKVKAEEGKTGAFSPVVYIQRLETKGGVKPAERPGRTGTKVGVPYTAVYYLYGKSGSS
jgi:hypothetical protein